MARRSDPTLSIAERTRVVATRDAIEVLRHSRKGRKHLHVSVEALSDAVPRYQQVKYRPEKSLPLTREEILLLCNHLECTTIETNQVLLAAHYEPVQEFLAGDVLARALAVARDILAYLPVPAYIITQDWHVQAWNRYLLRLFDLSEQQAQMLRLNGRLNILHFIFDPELGLRGSLGSEDGSWARMARRNVNIFWQQNILSRHDEWFKLELARLKTLPDFAGYWDVVQQQAPHEHDYQFVTVLHLYDGRTFRFRSLFIMNGSLPYPQVGFYMPLDAESRAILRDKGIPVLDDLLVATGGSESSLGD